MPMLKASPLVELHIYSAPREGRRGLLGLDFNENTMGPAPLLARQEVAAFDAFGAPFRFSAGSFTLPAEGPSLAAPADDCAGVCLCTNVPTSFRGGRD